MSSEAAYGPCNERRRATIRFPALDGLRGVLAFAMVLFHLEVAQREAGLPAIDGPAMIWIGRGIVWVFFALSAYVLVRAWGRVSFPVFLAQRALRLWPCMAVCVAGSCIALGYRLNPMWLSWISIEVPPDVPAWSLAYEARAMLCMPILVWCAGGRLWRAAALFALAGGVLGPSALHLGSAFAFILGARLARHAAPRVRLLEGPIVQFLGRISYSLYLCHWPIVGLSTAYLGTWALLFAVPAALAVATILWATVERQSIAWARSLGRVPVRGGSVSDASRPEHVPA